MANYSGSGSDEAASEASASQKSQSDHGSSEKSEKGEFWPIPEVPDGFTALTAPGGKTYLIPSFLTDATSFAYHRANERNGITLDTAAGGVSPEMLAAFVF
jgi:hypothetical protein